MIDRLQKALHLVELRRGTRQELTIVVRHATGHLGKEVVGRQISDIMSDPIELADSDTFEIHFRRYFVYLVRDEAGFPPEKDSHFDGTQFRRYQKSRFLDFVTETSFSDDVRPHPLYHYGVYCLNDLIDVISPAPPVISYLGKTSR
jgi:hypothetical protein